VLVCGPLITGKKWDVIIRHMCDSREQQIRGSSQGAHFEVYTLHSPLDAIQQR